MGSGVKQLRAARRSELSLQLLGCSEMKAYGRKIIRGNLAALRHGCWKVLGEGVELPSPSSRPCCRMLLPDCSPWLLPAASERSGEKEKLWV